MCASNNGQHLITGDASGLIYIWSLTDGLTESGQMKLQTFEIHKDKGAVTNLVAIHRPLSLFGLTANMQGYEPGEIKALNKNVQGINAPQQTCTIQLYPKNQLVDEDSDQMEDLAEYEELQYFAEASKALVTANKQSSANAQTMNNNTDFVAIDNTHEEQPSNEINRLREENLRLKKTLAEKFNSEFDH